MVIKITSDENVMNQGVWWSRVATAHVAIDVISSGLLAGARSFDRSGLLRGLLAVYPTIEDPIGPDPQLSFTEL
jgi:hypothetical protein